MRKIEDINTKCVRCGSSNTTDWRVDHNNKVKFYCKQDWLLLNSIDRPLIEKLSKHSLLRAIETVRVYLGFGHVMIHYSDGTKELRFVKTPRAYRVFYLADDWDEEGFPIWKN